MPELQGKPVHNTGEVWDGEPGVYYVIKDDNGVIIGLWFKLPTGGLGRISSTNVGKDPGHEWTITEDENGVVTVDPSIQQHAMPNREEPEYQAWHGHLTKGVWTS